MTADISAKPKVVDGKEWIEKQSAGHRFGPTHENTYSGTDHRNKRVTVECDMLLRFLYFDVQAPAGTRAVIYRRYDQARPGQKIATFFFGDHLESVECGRNGPRRQVRQYDRR